MFDLLLIILNIDAQIKMLEIEECIQPSRLEPQIFIEVI